MRRLIRLLCFTGAAIAVAACGSVSKIDDAGVTPTADAPVGGADAQVGGPDATPGSTNKEVTGAGGRTSGTTYEMDVQLGHPMSQQPASGSTHEIEGAAAVKP